VLGVFDRIAAPNFPVVHPKLVFVFRVRAEFADMGPPVAVRVRLVDEDGAVLFEASGELAPPPVEPGQFATANQIFSLVGVQFPSPGIYKFLVSVGEERHETPLSVVQLQAQGAWGGNAN
jgi:hypothetical protein